MTLNRTELEATKSALAAILSEAPPAPAFEGLSSPTQLQKSAVALLRHIGVFAVAAIVVLVVVATPILILARPHSGTPEPDRGPDFAHRSTTGPIEPLTLTVGLPDGAKLSLLYPEPLSLSTAEVHGSIVGRLKAGPYDGCGALLEMSRADATSLTSGAEPLASYLTRDNGAAELWAASSSHPAEELLIISVDDWTASIPFSRDDACPAEQLAPVWAESIALRVDDGWPAVEFFGDAAQDPRASGGPTVQLRSSPSTSVEMSSRVCNPETDTGTHESVNNTWFVVRCYDDLDIVVTISGDREYTAAAEGIQVEGGR